MSNCSGLMRAFCLLGAILLINGGAVITEPKDQPVYVQEGHEFVLKCRMPLESKPATPESVQIKWYFGTNDKMSALNIEANSDFITDQMVKEDKNGVWVAYSDLKKNNVQSADNGSYECRAANGPAGSGFITAVIVVKGDAVVGINSTLVVGQNAELQCKVKELNTPVYFTWARAEDPDKELDDENKYIVNDDNGTLTILKTVEEDAGKYICKFTMKKGGSMEQFVYLFSEPYVQRFEGKSKNLVEGDPLVLKCAVEAEPTPTITWLKRPVDSDETPLPLETSDSRVVLSEFEGVANATLRINDLEKEDRAEYMCLAVNEYGSHNETIVVRVKDKLAALWPFLGICAEVIILCTIIFIYEKRRAKKMEEEETPEEAGHLTNSHDHKEKDDIRQRK